MIDAAAQHRKNNVTHIEIELRSKDEQKLDAIWAQLREHLTRHNPALPFSPLHHVVRELVFNSIKANLKRIFLEADGAAPDFREALESFSPELLAKAEASNHVVRVRFEGRAAAGRTDAGPGGFEVSVFNNTEMLPGERELVDRLLYSDVQTDEPSGPTGESASGEGGGLGLRMVRKILQNCGLGPEALRYETGPLRTVFTLRVPAA